MAAPPVAVLARPALGADLRTLIGQMQAANPLWGAPRIHGELRKLGFEISQATVARYLARFRGPSGPSSQTWRTFLANHVSQLASCDFFTVPTATCRVLFVFVVLSHAGGRIVHFNVTAHPTAAWTGQQLREAFPWDTSPRFLLPDRDSIYGSEVRSTRQALRIEEVVTAPQAPWQNPFVERLIGTLRRDCLGHLIVWNERSVRSHLQEYLAYYNRERPHQALAMKVPAEVYRPSTRPYRGLQDVDYPLHDWTATVTRCGRICWNRRKINLSTVFAGQDVGVRQVSDRIWLVSFMDYDLGYFDDKTCRLEPIENPFSPKVLPMSPE
jgi:transposase InsO family protein